MNELIRVLIPSWRFFDGTVDAAVLYHRTSDDGVSFLEWQQTLPKPQTRTWIRLFLNAHENYLLAAHALMEHLKNDLEDQVDPSVSIELIQNLVRLQAPNTKHYQFKLVSQSIEFTSEVFT